MAGIEGTTTQVCIAPSSERLGKDHGVQDLHFAGLYPGVGIFCGKEEDEQKQGTE